MSYKPSVLITGLNGFTGQHLAAALKARGYAVFGLENTTHKVDLRQLTELTDLVQKIQPQYVVHLAAISFVAHENSADFYQTNLFGTLNLLQALQDAQVAPKKVIIASSANVYGNPNVDIIDETVNPLPINHYSNSKLAMEHMVRLWFDTFPIIITRPFNYTGPGQNKQFLTAKIVDHFQQKKHRIELGNMDVVRDISDINFVTQAYINLLEHSVESEIFNICSKRAYSIQNIIDTLQDIAGYTIQVGTNNQLVRKNEIKRLVGCNQKLLSTIGNIHTPVLYEILNRMYTNVYVTT